jgi:hypothetical protein
MDKIGNNNSKFHCRKVSISHLIYVVVICFIINIFILCIAPGRINQYAYDNFAFAATITSIVLAVVSIVYSLQSGLSSIGQLNSIREIENQITKELAKFTGIDDAIKQAINPISLQVGDMQKSQDEIQEHIFKLSDNTTKISVQNGSTPIQADLSEAMYIALYAASLSKETGMDLPFHIFARYLGPKQSRYCEGLLDGITAFNPDMLKLVQGSSVTRRKVEIFNLGDVDWKCQIKSIKDSQLASAFVDKVEQYYLDTKNQ